MWKESSDQQNNLVRELLGICMLEAGRSDAELGEQLERKCQKPRVKDVPQVPSVDDWENRIVFMEVLTWD